MEARLSVILLAERAEKFKITWNEEGGSLRVEMHGFWSHEDLHVFFPAMEKAMERSRARNGKALVLTDVTGSQVQNSVLRDRIKATGASYVMPGDRSAVVVHSIIHKQQMQRNSAETTDIAFFTSDADAEAWLHRPANGGIIP